MTGRADCARPVSLCVLAALLRRHRRKARVAGLDWARLGRMRHGDAAVLRLTGSVRTACVQSDQQAKHEQEKNYRAKDKQLSQ